jgi:hypothetical protein
MKSLTISYEESKVQEFGIGQLIEAKIGSDEFILIAVPVEAMKAMKPGIDAETGEEVPSKGFRASIGAKRGDEWGCQFAGQYALQLTVMKFNNVLQKIKRAF